MEPQGVKRPNVPHLKGLIYAKVELEAQGRDSTFTFCHALLKKAILYHKIALGPFVLHRTVCLIKLIFDTADLCNCVINELNPTYEVQNMGNWTFQNSPHGNAPFPNGS